VPPADPEQARWFAEHLQVHEPMLRAWLQSRFPQLGDIDDIVQEAYARVLAARAKQDIRSPKAFFFATARNLALEHFRRVRVANIEPFAGSDDLALLEGADDVVQTVVRNQEIELMTAAIQSLPKRCRQVMTLRNVYGLPQKDIAEQLGISVRTVEAQVTIGLKRCTAYLARWAQTRTP
jgi:RNA polymerase sigma factor (sigma-70 family)